MTSTWAEFERGWRVVAGSLLGISIGVSSLFFYSLGIFIKPIAAEFSWGRGAASLGALVGTASAALVAIPVGRLVDRVGSVPVALGSLALLALAFAALGIWTSSLASFLILTALLSLLTAGSTPLPYTRLVVAAFERARGLALGITLAGTGLGALLVPVCLTPFVARHGWRMGYFALAGVIVILSPLLWRLIRTAPEPAGTRRVALPFPQLIRSREFRLLALMFFLASLAILGTLVQFVPMLTDWGLSARKAGATAGLIGAAAIAGRLLVGLLLDRVAPLVVTAGVFLLVAGGLVLLGLAGPTFAVAGAVVLGLAVGAEVDLIAFLVGRYFLSALYGQTYGALYAVFLIGGALGPAISGYSQQATGDYRASLFGAGGCLIAAAALSIFLARIVSDAAVTVRRPLNGGAHG
jgi:MFS family permease